MWRDRIRSVLNWCLAICLTVLLLGSARLVAQPQSLVAECQEDSRKAAEQQLVEQADYDAWARAHDKLKAFDTTLRGYVARLKANPEQSDEVIRAILAVLSQMKQARADVNAAYKRMNADDDSLGRLEDQIENCFARLDRARGTGAGAGPKGHMTVILTVLDRTETVDLSFSNGTWNITGRLRQGIKLPSHDPAASDTTAPVKVDRQVSADVRVTPSLPPGWQIWLGIGADSKTPKGQNLCSDETFQCRATSGPYPGVKRGLGKGWAAGESVELWLCPGKQSCVGKTDPVASININWVLP
jgi:hypothetical protein